MGVVAFGVDAFAVASALVCAAIRGADSFGAKIAVAIAVFLAIHALLAGGAIRPSTVDIGLFTADRAIITPRKILGCVRGIGARIFKDIGALPFWQADVVRREEATGGDTFEIRRTMGR